MKPFTYSRPSTVDEAIVLLKGAAPNRIDDVRMIGGGTNLVDLMKQGVEAPSHLIDITRLPLNTIEEHGEGVRIGALVRNTDAASHPLIRDRYAVLSEAILAGASGQLRNMATMGGNLMQRTRCYYFYDPTFHECNKRTPGSGCAAKTGYNRIHAILGASEQCIATNPSDMAVALVVLGATVQVKGPRGERAIPILDFYRLPGLTPQLDTNLHPSELITAIDLPALPFAKHSTYLKIRDRRSYAFALVSVAAVLDIEEGSIRNARIALGGVAHKPWRAEAAERLLAGKKTNKEIFEAAAKAAVQGAKPYRDNAFKVELAQRTIVRALTTATNVV